MLGVLLVFIVLSFLVLIHELGHYIVARKCGIKVEEFGFGYPPRAKILGTRKGTIFTLNWLPFGGFVRLAGDDAETMEGLQKQPAINGAFSDQPKLKRLAVIAAGAVVNIVFGILVFGAIYTKVGIPVTFIHPHIDEVLANSPAEKAGLQHNDELIAVDGKAVSTTTDFIQAIGLDRGKSANITIVRSGKTLQVQSYIRTVAETPVNQGSLGVSLVEFELHQYPWWQRPFRGMWQGTQDSYKFAVMILDTLRSVSVQFASHGTVPKDFSSVIGITREVNREHLAEQGIIPILNFAALLSINLGVINLLPIPALDGGRGMFVIAETIIGKKRRAKIEQYANTAGMILLLCIIVLISIKDIFVR